MEHLQGLCASQRRHRQHVFSWHTQHFPRGDDKSSLRGKFQPAAHAGLGAARDLLEVVQQQQAGPFVRQARDGLAQLLHGVGSAQSLAQGLRHGVDDAVQSTGGAEVAEPGAPGVVTQPGAGVVQRQSGLANATQAQQRQQPGATLEGLHHGLQRGCATKEWVPRSGQVVGQLLQRQPVRLLAEHAVGLG